MDIYIREERFVHGRVASGSFRQAVLIMGCKMIIGNLAVGQSSTYRRHWFEM
jgi:hypothetical protein